MKSLKKNRRTGQTSVEYILIVGLLVGIVMLFGTQFKQRLGGIVDSLFGNIDKGISSLSK